MKVICDNCRAVYKIPDEKLVKPVNKATCRKCGHRMLIPRPRQGASPDEKTLVTAVPPTPSPAPGREARPGAIESGPPTTPLDEDPENTMPGVPDNAPGRKVAGPSDDVPLYAATPMPTPDRESRPAGVSGRSVAPPPPAPDLSYAGATPAGGAYRAATPAPGQRRTPGPVQRTATPAPDIAPPQMIDPSGTPEPARQRGRAPTPQPALQRSPRTPTPPPRAVPSFSPAAPAPPPMQSFPNPSTSSGHDPSGDMMVAIIGVCGAMFGALVLVAAFATTAAQLPVATLALVGVGTLLAFGGGLSSLLVILTGARGKRPARPLVSMVLGGGLGLLVTTTAVGLFVLKDQMFTGAVTLPGSGPAVAPGTPPSKADDPSVAAAVPTEPAPSAASATTPEAPPPSDAPSTAKDPAVASSSGSSSSKSSSSGGPVAETFEPRPAKSSSSSGSSSASSASVASSSSSSSSKSTKPPPPPPEDDLDFLEEEPEPAASNLPESVPDDVIDTILRNNLDLKKCFFNHKKATGSLPARVTVAFQLEPSGKIRDAGVTDEEFQGTELDACLGRALAAIQMPPSSGATRRVKYPFQLQ